MTSRVCDVEGVEVSWLGKEAEILAWFHAPSAPSRQTSIILCSPFGQEHMVSYRALRKLAVRLAASGFAVLRFDYAGTGDSQECAQPDTLVASWQQNIREAADYLRQRTGWNALSIIGLRLGALLAASVSEDLGVDSMVLIAPVINGRSFVREMQSFHSLLSRQNNAPDKLSNEENIGFFFPQSLRDQLQTLDITKMEAIRAKQVLILSRDDRLGQEAKIAKHLVSLGCSVTAIDGPGYAKLMTYDSGMAEVPEVLWTEVENWLSLTYPLATNQPFANVTMQNTRLTVSTNEYTEQVLSVDGVFGILTLPKGELAKHRPAIVMSNVGANHRTANHRLYVSIARHLASIGFAVVRFDKQGIGDSPAKGAFKENDVYGDQGFSDTIRIMDKLQADWGISTFVLAGICSGAYFAFRVAEQDARVVGLSMINILTFKWQDGDSLDTRREKSVQSTRFYMHSLVNRSTWKKLFTGKVHIRNIINGLLPRLTSRLNAALQSLAAKLLGRIPPMTPAAASIQNLLDRGVRVHGVFDSNDAGIDLWATNLGSHVKRFESIPHYQVDIIAGADHTFTPRWSQAWVLDTLSNYYLKHFR